MRNRIPKSRGSSDIALSKINDAILPSVGDAKLLITEIRGHRYLLLWKIVIDTYTNQQIN